MASEMSSMMSSLMSQQQSNHDVVINMMIALNDRLTRIEETTLQIAIDQRRILELLADLQEPITITFTPGRRRQDIRRQRRGTQPDIPVTTVPAHQPPVAPIPTETHDPPSPPPPFPPPSSSSPSSSSLSSSPASSSLAQEVELAPCPNPPIGAAETSPPLYEFPTDVKTVVGLVGLWDGSSKRMPAVEELESTWGNRWRPVKQKQYFSERKRIMDEVKRRSTITQREWKVVAIEMDRQKGDKSLNAYFKLIQSRRHVGSL